MHTTKTWILVADGAYARILENRGPRTGLKQLATMTCESSRLPSRELADTERGRVFQSGSAKRSAMERPDDPHQREKEKFAVELAAHLDKHIHNYDRLVLIAAPQMLGWLRQALSQHVVDRLYAELAKDLTPVANDELPKHLEDVIVIEDTSPDFSAQFTDTKP